MNAPHKSTYTVKVKIEDNFQGYGKCYVARDEKRDWRTFAKLKNVPDDITPESLVAGWMYHADEVESVSVVNGVITAIIREW